MRRFVALILFFGPAFSQTNNSKSLEEVYDRETFVLRQDFWKGVWYERQDMSGKQYRYNLGAPREFIDLLSQKPRALGRLEHYQEKVIWGNIFTWTGVGVMVGSL